jgi:hypothetical protein
MPSDERWRVCKEIADKILIEGELTLVPAEIVDFVVWIVTEYEKATVKDEIPY